jgi:DNA-binding beta-propeller fold protein YncE
MLRGGLVGAAKKSSSANAYSLANVSHVTTDSSFTGTVWDIAAKPDGTRIVTVGTDSGVTYLREYTFSTPWSVATISFVREVNIDATVGFGSGVAFNDDGTKLFITEGSINAAYSYDLPTAYSIVSLTNVDGGFGLNDPRGLHRAVINGTPYIFSVNFTSIRVERFSMSGDDVDNLIFDRIFNLNEAVPRGVTLSPDGTVMIVTDNDTDSVYQYNLSTAFDISTASYSGLSYDMSAVNPGPAGVIFGDNGKKMLVSGFLRISEFDLV